jgi:hypothetical protein
MRKAVLLLLLAAPLAFPQQAAKVWTIQELFTRNVGGAEQQNNQFPPHKIIGNVYYVGTESLSSFLVTTSQGHILINSIFERNVPVIQTAYVDQDVRRFDVTVNHAPLVLAASNCRSLARPIAAPHPLKERRGGSTKREDAFVKRPQGRSVIVVEVR